MKAALLTVTLLLAAALEASASEGHRSVTLDVKDEDVRVILKSMQTQCGVRNLLIDREVRGSGMVYFREVPCGTAFRTVLRQFGLQGQVEPAVVAVEPRRR